MQTITPTIQQDKLEAFMGKMVGDLGSGITGALVIIGDRLGLYRAMAKIGSCTAQQLAEATGTNERYIREWLLNQAAAEYIDYDDALDTFFLPPENAAVLADEDSPFHLIGGFYNLGSVFNDEEMLSEAFRSGEGIPWGRHHTCLFCGTARFFKASYEGNLLQTWIPALDGIEDRLKSGIAVADIGCGFGESTILMARAFPDSTFVGVDIHGPSIEHANEHAAELDLKNVSFHVGSAQDFEGDFDLVTSFDCLHDMGDPVGAAEHVHTALSPGGSWMVVEPFASDTVSENFNPIGRVFYGFSATICVPASMSEPVGLALGAQAGPSKIREVISNAGFSYIRIADQSPLNLVFESRKQG